MAAICYWKFRLASWLELDSADIAFIPSCCSDIAESSISGCWRGGGWNVLTAPGLRLARELTLGLMWYCCSSARTLGSISALEFYAQLQA